MTKLTQRDKTKMALTSFWMAVFLLNSAWLARRLKLTWLDVLLTGLTVTRLGRMVSYDLMAEPWRKSLVKTVEDDSGAGKTTVPRYEQGVKASLGELLVCPICIGTWLAAGVIYFQALFPPAGRMFVSIVGVVGMAEIIHALIEALQWSGQLNREQAGEK
jgi:hypothetical protein